MQVWGCKGLRGSADVGLGRLKDRWRDSASGVGRLNISMEGQCRMVGWEGSWREAVHLGKEGSWRGSHAVGGLIEATSNSP